MSIVRRFVYTALLAVTAVNLMSGAAVAQGAARGNFRLTHDVYWGNARVPAGDYEFFYEPYQAKPVLTLTRLNGPRAGFMLLVATAADSKPWESNRLLLETTPDSTYVSTMQLAECGVTLYFPPPSHSAKPITKSVTTVVSSRE